MTFEGFDAAPLIEGAGFSPLPPGGATVLMAGADGTLEAALQAAGLGPRAALDAHDLWVPRGGGHGADIFERAGMAAFSGTSWRGWPGQGDADHAVLDVTKDVILRAALWDDVDGDGEEDEPITVTGTRNVNDGTGDGDGGGYGAGFYPGTTGYEGDMGDGGSLNDPNEPNDCRDRKAIEAQTLINGQPDDQAREYGAIIYRGGDGRVQISDIFQGDQSHVPQTVIMEWM